MSDEFKTRHVSGDEAGVVEAVRCLRAGRLVALPTETVYGLAADATNAEAVARIYEAKGRPRFNPLIAHVASVDDAARVVVFGPVARRCAEAFWPGPLTLVARRRPGAGLAEIATAGLETVAVRMPDHDVARAILSGLGRPLVAPSANRSGRVSPTSADHVLADLDGRIDLVVDAGPCRVGLESTIVDLSEDARRPTLLRAGGTARDDLEAALGVPLRRPEARAGDPEAPRSPGQLRSHYAPRASLRLNANAPVAGEALLAFGPDVPAHEGPCFNLSPSGDLVEAAAKLFGALRRLDAANVSTIAVMPVPGEGLGEAIRDRLARAAAPRREE